MRTLLTTLLAFLTLVGCETRTHKQLRLKHQALLIEHERVLEQMNKIWLQSLKARFPLITELEPGKQISLDPKRMRYIHSLQFEPDPHLANQWQIQVTHLAQKTNVHPNYVVFVFDRRGLNIGKLRVDPKKWLKLRKATLEKGVPTQFRGEMTLDLPEQPRYFWIRFLE